MKHKIILSAFIIIVSAIYGLPNIILAAKLGKDYQPLVIHKDSPIAKDETYAYAPQVKHILEGNLFMSEVYVSEYQNFPTPFLGESLPAILMAILAKLTGSLSGSFIAADFIFPPIIFLLLFIVTRLFIKNFFFAASVAFLTTIARDFIAVIPYPHETLQYITVAEQRNFLLHFSRAFHPQVTFVFFVLAFISLVKVLSSPGKWVPVAVLGIFFASLFYSYVFYWTYFVAFMAIIFGFYILKRNFQVVRSLVLAGVIAFILVFPYFFNMYSFYKLEIADDFIAKSSLAYLDLPLTLFRYLTIALIFAQVTKLKDPKLAAFPLFILTGVLIPLISKIVIGQDLETLHYLRRAMMPFATVAVFIIFYNIFIRSKKIIYFTAVILLAIIAFLGIKTQIVATQTISPYHRLDKDLEEVFVWLNNNSRKNEVIGSVDTFFSRYLPVYTHNKVFFPPADRTITPTYEGVERYAIVANLLGIDPKWQKENLTSTLSYMFIYQAYSPGIGLDYNSPKRFFAEDLIDKLKNTEPAVFLDKYQLDYIVVTPQEREAVSPKPTSVLKPQTAFGQYLIYKVER